MSRHANRQFEKRRSGADRTRGHQDWIELIDTDGPWLSLPVLTATWPELDAVTPEQRQQLKHAHSDWSIDRDDPAALPTWLRAILADFLGWGDKGLHFASRPDESVDGVAPLLIGQHDTTVSPSFTLHDGEHVRVIGLVTPIGTHPAKRMPGETWAASPIDRLVRLCNAAGVDLGIATDGRYLALVYAPAVPPSPSTDSSSPPASAPAANGANSTSTASASNRSATSTKASSPGKAAGPMTLS